MKRSQPSRDWRAAERKRTGCRNCPNPNAQLHHIAGRVRDKQPPVVWDDEMDGPWRPYRVAPARVMPLCKSCHDDEADIDILRLLTTEEQVQAVADFGSITRAMDALIPRPTAYAGRVAA